MQIALIGTRGVPARYGGFETLVEEVGQRLVNRGHRVVVYCRRTDESEVPSHYLGMELVQLPIVRRRTMETLAHTALSVVHRSLAGVDVALVFNAANAPLLPVIRGRGKPVATHVDGLEWQRGKWGPTGRRYYRIGEALAVRWSDALIADAVGIQDYYRDEFGAETELIAYGAPILAATSGVRLAELNLERGGFHLVVARFEPENHVLEIVQGYVRSRSAMPLVVVGSAPYSDKYTAAVHAAADDRVRFLGGVWDQDLLNELYASAASYVHGHSVGGTNPSLLRAAGAGAYTIGYDINFNREVVGEHGSYFSGPDDLATELELVEKDVDRARAKGLDLQVAIGRYNWDDVTDRYEQLCQRLATHQLTGRRASGRRNSSSPAAP